MPIYHGSTAIGAVYKGSAAIGRVYSGTDLVFQAAGGDPSWANVVLLLSGDGADGSTTFADQSANPKGNATVSGNAQVDTAQSKFGGGAMLFDGNGDLLSFADSDDWHFGSGAFTVEAWIRFAGTSGTQTIASHYSGTTARSWSFHASANFLSFHYSTAGTSATTFPVARAWTPSANTWYHVAVARDGTDLRFFVDGIMLGTSEAIAATLFNSTTVFRIGSRFTTANADFFNGHIDELRITKGAARYTANFSVPTEAFPRG